MANINVSKVNLGSEKVLQSIFKNENLNLSDLDLCEEDKKSHEAAKAGKNKLAVHTRWGDFHPIMKALSKKFPKQQMRARYQNESDNFFKVRFVRYKNGEAELYKIKYNYEDYYKNPDIERLFEDNGRDVYKRIKRFVDQCYKQKIINEGEEVTYSFLESMYKVSVEIPFGAPCKIMVLKQKIHEPEWVPVEEGDQLIDLPF